jgi:hypothetical protein
MFARCDHVDNESKDLNEYDWKKNKRKKCEDPEDYILCFIDFHKIQTGEMCDVKGIQKKTAQARAVY